MNTLCQRDPLTCRCDYHQGHVNDGRKQARAVNTSQLGRICIDPNDRKRIAGVVREALRRTDSAILYEAADLVSDAACVTLYKLLNPS